MTEEKLEFVKMNMLKEVIQDEINESIKKLISFYEQVGNTETKNDLEVMMADATHLKIEIEETLNGKYYEQYKKLGIIKDES